MVEEADKNQDLGLVITSIIHVKETSKVIWAEFGIVFSPLKVNVWHIQHAIIEL